MSAIQRKLDSFDFNRKKLDALIKRTKQFNDTFRGNYAKDYSHDDVESFLWSDVELKKIKQEIDEYNESFEMAEAVYKSVEDDEDKTPKYLHIRDTLTHDIEKLEEMEQKLGEKINKNEKSKSRLSTIITKSQNQNAMKRGLDKIEQDYNSKKLLTEELIKYLEKKKRKDERLRSLYEYKDNLNEMKGLIDVAKNQEASLKRDINTDIEKLDNNTAFIRRYLDTVLPTLNEMKKIEHDVKAFINSSKLVQKTEDNKVRDAKLLRKALKEDALSIETKKRITNLLGLENGLIAAQASVSRQQEGLNVHIFDLVDGGKMRMPSTISPYLARTNADVQLAVGQEFDYLKLKPVPVYKKGHDHSPCFAPNTEKSGVSRQPDQGGKDHEMKLLKGFTPVQMTEMQKLVYHLYHPYAYDMNALFVHSAGSGKSWLMSLLASTMARGGYSIMFIIDDSISKELYDAILHHCADFNVQNFLIGHGGSLSKEFTRTEKAPECMAGKIHSTGKNESRGNEDDDDDDEDDEDDNYDK